MLAGSGWFAAPAAVFEDSRLTVSERIVFLYLHRMKVPEIGWPSYRQIAAAAGISEPEAVGAVDGLHRKGWIEAVPQSAVAGGDGDA